MWSWAKIHAPDRSFGSFLMCNIQWLLIERPIPKTEIPSGKQRWQWKIPYQWMFAI